MPHWEVEGGTYFITYRTHDSLPLHVVERLREETSIAEVIAGNLRHFDGERYRLFAWCVMPNHVHVVATLRWSLAKVLHGWKSYVSHEVGERLWAREYFDRLVRDERDLAATVKYVRANPGRAGLRDWACVG